MIASPNPPVVGIDVAARWLDCSWPGGQHLRVPNSPNGWKNVIRESAGCVIALEATGVYYFGMAQAAFEDGLGVRVINPWQVRTFAISRLSRTKTDKVDAGLIREFAERLYPDLRAWYPPPPGLLRVSALVRLGDGLVRHRVAAGNRVHALQQFEPMVAEVAVSIGDALREERARVMAEALRVGKEDDLVGMWLSQLVRLPGFGEVSALKFLAYAGDVRRFGSARQFAAYTGLTPKFQQSGTREAIGSISRMGSRPLRSVLYMSALSAVRTKSSYGDLHRRLVAAGRPRKVGIVAVANRLARAAWSVCVR